MNNNANKGIKRNKKPLRNIEVKIVKREDGLYHMFERIQGTKAYGLCFATYTFDEIKEKLTPNQWCKFQQGQKEFVIQRRVNKHNI